MVVALAAVVSNQQNGRGLAQVQSVQSGQQPAELFIHFSDGRKILWASPAFRACVIDRIHVNHQQIRTSAFKIGERLGEDVFVRGTMIDDLSSCTGLEEMRKLTPVGKDSDLCLRMLLMLESKDRRENTRRGFA